MKQNSANFWIRASLPFVAAFGMMTVTGCGSNNDPVKEDPAALQKRVDSAKEMRAYFEKSRGNYDSLSPADKDALNKLTGSEANSRTAFSHMGPSGGTSVVPAGGGLPPSGG